MSEEKVFMASELVDETQEGPQQIGLSPDIQLPDDRYQVCCIEEKSTKSSKGNAMLVQTWEIVGYEAVNPETGRMEQRETYPWGDKDLVVKGTELKKYYITTCVLDENKNVDKEKTRKSKERLIKMFQLLGVYDPDEEINLMNPPCKCKGIVADATCTSEEYVQRKSPTPEQIAKGIKFGDPITDKDGKELKGHSAALKFLLEARPDLKVDVAF